MKKLEGKVALITGAADLGKDRNGLCHGVKMCLVDLLPEVEETAKELQKLAPKSSLMSETSPQRAYERAQEGKRRLRGSEWLAAIAKFVAWLHLKK